MPDHLIAKPCTPGSGFITYESPSYLQSMWLRRRSWLQSSNLSRLHAFEG
jgi:hypothetical protein